jgi:hypothetical protein
MTIWLMRFTRWLPRTTDARSEHAIRTAFPLRQFAQSRLSVTNYVLGLSCFFVLPKSEYIIMHGISYVKVECMLLHETKLVSPMWQTFHYIFDDDEKVKHVVSFFFQE